jgi:hypothetical protein
MIMPVRMSMVNAGGFMNQRAAAVIDRPQPLVARSGGCPSGTVDHTLVPMPPLM